MCVCFSLILINLIRIICRYNSGERLTPEHEEIVVKMLLPYHPKYEEKIGGGIDHIKVYIDNLNTYMYSFNLNSNCQN